jgi:hypothetical protein
MNVLGARKNNEWGRQGRAGASASAHSASNGTIIDILHKLKRTAQPSSAPESNSARQTGGKNEIAA